MCLQRLWDPKDVFSKSDGVEIVIPFLAASWSCFFRRIFSFVQMFGTERFCIISRRYKDDILLSLCINLLKIHYDLILLNELS